MVVREWDGTAWQDFCIELLRIRYSNHNLVEVPDRHNGDLGLEAFTHDGVAFQCYAAQEPLSIKDLYTRQRDKLTTDLGKLQMNQSKLVRLLNGVAVRRYVFLVHRHDSKELVMHAQMKASEVRGWNLPFIGNDFAITVETDDNYAQERDALTLVPTHLVVPPVVRDHSITEWARENATLVGAARVKLSNIGIQGAALNAYLEELSKQFLLGENALTILRSKYPSSWSAVSTLKSDKENMLTLEYPPGSTTSGVDVRNIVKEVSAEILRDVPSISPKLAHTLAWSIVADWILRCPLDFPESA